MAKLIKPGIIMTEALPCGGRILYEGGGQKWYDSKDRLHREDGPAVKARATEEYYKHGMMHRTDGPALIYGDTTQIWYVNNIRIDTWEQYSYETGMEMKDIMVMVMKNGWKMSPSLNQIGKNKQK